MLPPSCRRVLCGLKKKKSLYRFSQSLKLTSSHPTSFCWTLPLVLTEQHRNHLMHHLTLQAEQSKSSLHTLPNQQFCPHSCQYWAQPLSSIPNSAIIQSSLAFYTVWVLFLTGQYERSKAIFSAWKLSSNACRTPSASIPPLSYTKPKFILSAIPNRQCHHQDLAQSRQFTHL